MDPELRRALNNYFGPRKPVHIRHFSTADPNLGHSSDFDGPLPSRGKRDGGTLPQTTQGGAHRPRFRRAREVVLEAANGSSRNTHDRQAGHWRVSI